MDLRLLAICCLLPGLLLAHAPDDPTNIMSFKIGGTENNPYGDSYGGYGFLASSEAESQSRFQFQCSERNQVSYIESFCNTPVTGIGIEPSEFLSEHLQNIVLNRLREQTFEYYTYQLNSSGGLGDEAPRLPRPSCIDENGQLWRGLSTTGVLSESPAPTDIQKAKAAAVDIVNEPLNMAKAWFYSNKLDHEIDNYDCRSPSEMNEQNCVPLMQTNYRLRSSFPSIWMYNSQGTTERNLGGHSRRYNLADDFGASFAYLIGAYEARDDDGVTSLAQAAMLGNQVIDQGQRGGAADYAAFESKMKKAFFMAKNAAPNSLMGRAWTRMMNRHTLLRNEHRTQMSNELRCLCPDTPNCRAEFRPWDEGDTALQQIRKLSINKPNMLRQALLDMDESERYLSQAVLCQTGVMDFLRMEPQCHGVTGGPLPGNEAVSIDRRKVNDWPYGSQNNYTISRPSEPADAPYEVNLTVNLRISEDVITQAQADAAGTTSAANGLPESVNQLITGWQNDVEGFLNCSTGQHDEDSFEDSVSGETRSCPHPADGNNNPFEGLQRTPGVKFNITMNPTTEESPDPPVVNLHRCFNADIEGDDEDRSDCSNVRGLFLEKCATYNPKWTNSQCEENYDEVAGGDRPYRLDRANSANYTTRSHTGTIRHEVLHLMGVPDEYSSTRKPFSRLGDHDSIMNRSKGDDSRIYGRHLDAILEPLECTDS